MATFELAVEGSGASGEGLGVAGSGAPDPGPGDSLQSWTGAVDCGDGLGPQPLLLNADKTFALAHEYTEAGTYTVTVTVTDDEGAVGTDTLLVTVEPTLYWDGVDDGDWNDPARWVDSLGTPLDRIPDENTRAVLRNNTVTVGADCSVGNLTVESGAILVGAGNTLTVEGDAELAGEAEYVSEINGTANGLIAAGGNVTLGGALNIQPAGVGNVNPSDPGNNIGDHVYTLLDTGPDGSVLGKFTTEPPLDDPATLNLREDQLGFGVFNLEKLTYVGRSDPDDLMEPATSVTAKLFIATGGDGDGNGDGKVDTVDITNLVANFGLPDRRWEHNDTAGGTTGRGDGKVDTLDITDLVANFGISAASQPDPGPATKLGTGEKATTIEKVSAHDAVLKETASRESQNGRISMATMDWLYDCDQITTTSRPSNTTAHLTIKVAYNSGVFPG